MHECRRFKTYAKQLVKIEEKNKIFSLKFVKFKTKNHLILIAAVHGVGHVPKVLNEIVAVGVNKRINIVIKDDQIIDLEAVNKDQGQEIVYVKMIVKNQHIEIDHIVTVRVK